MSTIGSRRVRDVFSCTDDRFAEDSKQNCAVKSASLKSRAILVHRISIDLLVLLKLLPLILSFFVKRFTIQRPFSQECSLFRSLTFIEVNRTFIPGIQ